MEDKAGGGGYAGDPSEHFHRNEAISAVTDDGFLGEEDDDYEDLYNDVNVGENFLQSMKTKNADPALERRPMQVNLKPTLPQQGVQDSGVPGGPGGERKFEKDDDGLSSTRVSSGRVMDGYPQQNTGFRGPAVGVGGTSVPPGGGGGGLRVELGQPTINKGVGELEEHTVSNNVPNQAGMFQHQPPLLPPPVGSAPVVNVAPVGNTVNEGLVRQGGGNVNVNGAAGNGFGNIGAAASIAAPGGGTTGSGGQGTILFVGDLHWWTTDAELEAELSKYGPVKEVKFFDEKASGKSKGYCQVEFYDPAAATACKEGMHMHMFNGRPCLVAFASPATVKRMGEAQVNRSQQMSQSAVTQGRRGIADTSAKAGGSNIATGGNYQAGGDNNRGYGRGNWGRGNTLGIGGRGTMGPMRGRAGGMGGRGMMGNGGSGFGQGIGAPPLMHPQAMMGQGFDPGFGGPMGRMGGYGGFPGAPTPPLGILSSFPPVGSVGLPGVAPHVNPAFFGRGMPMNSMGMMPTAGVDGPNMGMWSDSNMGWAGEEHGGRAGESSYGEEAASEHQYGEVSHDRGPWPNSMKEKDRAPERDRGSERDWSGSSERRYRDDREPGFDRDMPREKELGQENDWEERRHREERDSGRERERERDRDRERSRDRDRERDRERDRHRDERDRHADHHRYKEREAEYGDDWDRGRSSRTHSKTRLSHAEEQRSRSRDAEYGKRRRITSE